MKIDMTKDRRAQPDMEPGEYDFTITRCDEMNQYASPAIKLSLKLEKDGAYIGYISQFISSSREGEVKDLCSAVGLSDALNQSGVVPVNQLEGLTGKCVIKERKQMTVDTFTASGSIPKADSFASSDIPF